MNAVYRYRQSHLIGASVGAQCIALYLSFSHGQLKPFDQIAWLDVTGEGSVMLFAFAWIIAAIASRPPGRVTTLLVAGLNCFAFTALLDFLDEMFTYSAASDWLSMLESMPAAFGMVIMTAGLLGWHNEQKALNRQLQRREWALRNHGQIDSVTQLYLADYWQERLTDLKQQGGRGSAIMIDINGFSRFNEAHGYAEGDRFLQEIARLLVMHVRESDLVCRYAGDRFVILMPDTAHPDARRIAGDIQTSVHCLAFKSGANTTALFQSVRTAVAEFDVHHDSSRLLSDLQDQLNHQDTQAA